jgi:hypothetical protein
MPLPTVDELLDQSIAAYQEGDRDSAPELLARVIQLDPNSERAWLWLSGIVTTNEVGALSEIQAQSHRAFGRAGQEPG